MTVPEGLDWDIYRITSSSRWQGTTAPIIRETWTMEDLLDAHLVEDMYDEAEAKARKGKPVLG